MYKQKHISQIENAIEFLVKKITNSSTNPKPVIFHSLKVAFFLEKLGYDNEIFMGALLHDILEDTNVTFEEIVDKFGNNIGELVLSNTFNKNITNSKEQYENLFEKCRKQGKKALIIKAGDIYDNSFYYKLTDNLESFLGLLDKMKYFIQISNQFIKHEAIYIILVKQYNIIVDKYLNNSQHQSYYKKYKN